ncbi:prostate-associated microseminoprotein-like [Branchiostoma floridae]|uniref:Prostate-associated microseminoprotein-like n=1 Tax=Branchiostoma floridae TaxID=7739 RepID=A0A9J7M2D6_BRAFL|nr:prostate-associated microseminoprotein-like [Branchiostoma floridae]
MRIFIALVLVMCVTWRVTEGYTYFAQLQSEDRLYGPEGNVRVVSTQYCEWEGKKMMIGSSWKTTGCEQCSCSEAGLFCAGSGRYLVPDHCLLLVDETCQTELVDANDPFSPCGMPQVFHGK